MQHAHMSKVHQNPKPQERSPAPRCLTEVHRLVAAQRRQLRKQEPNLFQGPFGQGARDQGNLTFQ